MRCYIRKLTSLFQRDPWWAHLLLLLRALSDGPKSAIPHRGFATSIAVAFWLYKDEEFLRFVKMMSCLQYIHIMINKKWWKCNHQLKDLHHRRLSHSTHKIFEISGLMLKDPPLYSLQSWWVMESEAMSLVINWWRSARQTRTHVF